jgi:hypothetical protein
MHWCVHVEGKTDMRETAVDVDIWLRGTQHASTRHLVAVATRPDLWTDEDVRTLLIEMLRAIEREKNPGGEPPPISLRGFNWIVSPYQQGVVLHLEMAMGTASAGPFAIDGDRLTAMVTRVMATPDSSSASVH